MRMSYLTDLEGNLVELVERHPPGDRAKRS